MHSSTRILLLLLLLLLLITAAPVVAADTNAATPDYVVGDILEWNTSTQSGQFVIAKVDTTGLPLPDYTTYEVVQKTGRWEIPEYWNHASRVPGLNLVTDLHAHRVAHADPVVVVITDPTITGGDMQYTGLSLAEVLAGGIYPVEPAPGEFGSGIPLYVVGDILGNVSTPTRGTMVASVRTDNGQLFYGTFEVVKNGERWEIGKYWHGDFSFSENVLISIGMRRIAHADPHTVVVTDTTITGGDMKYTGLSLAEIHTRGGGYGVELWQDQPYPGTLPRYLAGDILGNDTSSVRYMVATVAVPADPEAFPVYTTYEVVKNGSRWEIPIYWNGDHQVDALQVFNRGQHRLDHADPHTVVLTDTTTTGFSLGEILNRTLPGDQEPAPVPPGTNTPRDLNHDGLYEDLNGNGAPDFNDVVIFFNQMDWIADNEPAGAFDFNRNGRIDFNDIVILFNGL